MADSPFKNSEAYQYNAERFKLIKDIKDETELRTLLADLSKFVNSEASTIKGQYAIMNRRAEAINREYPDLHLETMNNKELLGFFSFLDYMKEKNGTILMYHVSPGAQRAQAYDEKIKEMISKGDYDEAKQRMYEIQGQYTLPSDQISAEEIKKAFEVK